MEKKSLIKTLKTTKKANMIKSAAKNEGSTTRKAMAAKKAVFHRAGKMGPVR